MRTHDEFFHLADEPLRVVEETLHICRETVREYA